MATRRVKVNFDFDALSRASTPQEVIASIEKMLSSVPDEFRSSVVWNLGRDWDTGWEIDVYYDRPETEADRQLDARREQEAEAEFHRAEYERYQRLKAKYEPNT